MSKLIFYIILSYSLAIIVGSALPRECELPSVTGPCRAYIPSFYFNISTNQCESFIYGGCGGNANRFTSEEECMAYCDEDARNNWF